MSVIFLIIPIVLLVVFAAVLAFIWATRKGQFDDMETPAVRILHEDEEATTKPGPDRR